MLFNRLLQNASYESEQGSHDNCTDQGFPPIYKGLRSASKPQSCENVEGFLGIL